MLALVLLLAAAAQPAPEALGAGPGIPGRAAPGPAPALIRQAVAEAALAQAERVDPAWPEAQRDCAGLVRWAYRAAFHRLSPGRVAAGLWADGDGRPSAFADAATLLRRSFAFLGRGEEARRRLLSGDLVAFSRVGEDGAPVVHLMLVLRPGDPAHGRTLVVYHPGDKGAAVRLGALEDLAADAPSAWKPLEGNPLFLGYYRFKEWMP